MAPKTKKKKYKVNKNLFIYLTKEAGHTLDEAAEAMGIARQALNRRLDGTVGFKAPEMEAWMILVGCTNGGPVFFPGMLESRFIPGDPGAVVTGYDGT